MPDTDLLDDLNDIALVIFADLGASKNGKRLHTRISTIVSGITGGGGFYDVGPPKWLRALVATGLATARTNKNSPPGHYMVEITDKGREFHRSLMQSLRSQAPAAGGAK